MHRKHQKDHKGRSAVTRLQAVLLFLLQTLFISAAWAGDIVTDKTPVSHENMDTLQQLQELVVQSRGMLSPRISDDGTVRMEVTHLQALPRYFGEADLLRALRFTAGVTATSDLASGFIVDGMDMSQNAYTLNGAPVQFPYHFGGIFSVFGSWQYPRVELAKSIRRVGTPQALGGVISMKGRDKVPDRFRGSFNLGLTASSAGVDIPLGKHFAINGLARVSYIDALLGPLTSTAATSIRYSFYDADIAAIYTPDNEQTLRVYAHHNGDRLKYGDSNYDMDTRLKWRNILAGADWSGNNTDAYAYYSEMSNTLSLIMQDINVMMPSTVRQAGFRGSWHAKYGMARVEAGAGGDWYAIRPQDIDTKGLGIAPDSHVRTTVSWLATAWATARLQVADFLRIDPGVESNTYITGSYRHTDVDPRLSLIFRTGTGRLTLHAGRYHQYIHQVGFSEIGMPSNFKIAASQASPPQESLNVAAAYSTPLPWLGMKINADAYYRRVLSQPEYFGGVLDVLSDSYSPDLFIRTCSGYNYGFGVTLSASFSGLSATAGYNFGIARRRLPDSSVYFTATSEVRNAVNVAASYTINDHWSVDAVFNYMTGRPITPVKAVYFIGKYLAVEYGTRNSARLPDYHRLDIGGSYKFFTGNVRHTVALSIINVYGHRNPEAVRFRYNSETGTIYKSYLASLYRFIPSFSYSIDL
ncbi:TonB-dependent receptor plug domain-containing protein [Muribaculum intestinale]|uniref:TonB-dependent receptor plug domain-containing protein n=1 Tax=Muribaculum intestinale TaxID=1796646 RepID=UPI00260D12C6|nr:hypothetical protein [Muribaculum intestinale]